MTQIIALLTDFGTTDAYVGVMKGVMLGICPDAQLIDLTHAIEPQNVKQAAFVLLNNLSLFPDRNDFSGRSRSGCGQQSQGNCCAGGRLHLYRAG